MSSLVCGLRISCGGLGTVTRSPPSVYSIRLTTYGFTSFPPFPSDASAVTTLIGLIAIPWPKDAVAYSISRRDSRLSIRPATSFGRSIPVSSPRWYFSRKYCLRVPLPMRCVTQATPVLRDCERISCTGVLGPLPFPSKFENVFLSSVITPRSLYVV